MSRSTNRQVDPEVWFRIVHLAQVSHPGAPVAPYREQTVEIALGPKGADSPEFGWWPPLQGRLNAAKNISGGDAGGKNYSGPDAATGRGREFFIRLDKELDKGGFVQE